MDEMDTKELVAELRTWGAPKKQRARPLMRKSADAIERLERERDVLAKAYDSEKEASSQYREYAATKSMEKIDEFRRAESAISELTILRARVEKLEGILRRIQPE